MTVDRDVAMAQLEVVAAHIASAIKSNTKVFGGEYRLWLADSLPGQKLRIDCWYKHGTPGALCLNVEHGHVGRKAAERAIDLPRGDAKAVRARAGLDLDMMGYARTHMNLAIASGMRAAGLQYSLPPVAGPNLAHDADVDAHMRHHLSTLQSADGHTAGGTQGGTAAAARSSGDTAAQAAAAETLLLQLPH